MEISISDAGYRRSCGSVLWFLGRVVMEIDLANRHGLHEAVVRAQQRISVQVHFIEKPQDRHSLGGWQGEFPNMIEVGAASCGEKILMWRKSPLFLRRRICH